MLLHEGLRQRQPQTRPAFAPRHQRVEDAIADRLGHARAVVLDMQFQCQSPALLADGDLPRDARAQQRCAHRRRRCARRAPAPRCARCSAPPGSAARGRRGTRGSRCRSRAATSRPRGNSARISERTRSQTSWMLTSPTTCGLRCGASRRSTSACSRSASWMMTCVYSVERPARTRLPSPATAPRRGCRRAGS